MNKIKKKVGQRLNSMHGLCRMSFKERTDEEHVERYLSSKAVNNNLRSADSDCFIAPRPSMVQRTCWTIEFFASACDVDFTSADGDVQVSSFRVAARLHLLDVRCVHASAIHVSDSSFNFSCTGKVRKIRFI